MNILTRKSSCAISISVSMLKSHLLLNLGAEQNQDSRTSIDTEWLELSTSATDSTPTE